MTFTFQSSGSPEAPRKADNWSVEIPATEHFVLVDLHCDLKWLALSRVSGLHFLGESYITNPNISSLRLPYSQKSIRSVVLLILLLSDNDDWIVLFRISHSSWLGNESRTVVSHRCTIVSANICELLQLLRPCNRVHLPCLCFSFDTA